MTKKMVDFIARYEGMDEWQIADIHAKEKDLTDEARAALAEVIARRGINIRQIRKEMKKDVSDRTEKNEIILNNKRARDVRIYKVFLIIAILIAVLGAVLRPDRAVETAVSSLVQAAGLALIGWLAIMVKRFVSRLKEKER